MKKQELLDWIKSEQEMGNSIPVVVNGGGFSWLSHGDKLELPDDEYYDDIQVLKRGDEFADFAANLSKVEYDDMTFVCVKHKTGYNQENMDIQVGTYDFEQEENQLAVKSPETTYRIVGKTDGWIAQRDAIFKGRERVVIERGLTLKEAQEKLLDMYNEDYDFDGMAFANWGLCRIHNPHNTWSHNDGTRGYEYDGRRYSIEIEDYIIDTKSGQVIYEE